MASLYQQVYEGFALDPQRPSDLDYQAIYSLVDEPAMEAAAAARVRWERWDQESPINEVPAETIKQRADFAGGEVYLILMDDQIVSFQPHGPGEGLDPITPEELPGLAQAQVDAMVENLVVGTIGEFVRAQYQKMLDWRAQQEFAVRQAGVPGERKGAV